MSHLDWSQRASSERPMHPPLPSGRGWGVARRQVPCCRSALLFSDNSARHPLPEKLLAHACHRTAITIGLAPLLAPSVVCSQRTVLKLIQVNRQIQGPPPQLHRQILYDLRPWESRAPTLEMPPNNMSGPQPEEGKNMRWQRPWELGDPEWENHTDIKSQHMSLGVLGSP